MQVLVVLLSWKCHLVVSADGTGSPEVASPGSDSCTGCRSLCVQLSDGPLLSFVIYCNLTLQVSPGCFIFKLESFIEKLDDFTLKIAF